MNILNKKSKTLVYNEIEWVERKVALEEIERLNKENEHLKQKFLIDKHTKMLLMSTFGMRSSGKTYYEKLKEFNRLLNKAIIIKQEDNYILCNMTKQELYEMIYKYRKVFMFNNEN